MNSLLLAAVLPGVPGPGPVGYRPCPPLPCPPVACVPCPGPLPPFLYLPCPLPVPATEGEPLVVAVPPPRCPAGEIPDYLAGFGPAVGEEPTFQALVYESVVVPWFGRMLVGRVVTDPAEFVSLWHRRVRPPELPEFPPEPPGIPPDGPNPMPCPPGWALGLAGAVLVWLWRRVR